MPTGHAARTHRGPMLSRRTLLAGAAATLAACAGGSDTRDAASPSSPVPSPGATVPLPNASDAVGAALEAVGLGSAALALTPQATWAELLTGLTTHLLLVVGDDQGEILTDPVDLWLVGLEGDVVAGPLTTTWYPDDRLPTDGLHGVEIALADDQAGTFDLVVATSDGARAGTAGIRALPPEESVAPAQGASIPAIQTPTTDDQMDLDELCTREENCGLHDVSLDDALAEDRPVVLCISTPKYCATAICGPVLEDVLGVATADDAPDATYIHVEPYTDANQTLTDLVDELQLPTEPWTYVLAPGGEIVDRYPGPVIPDLLRAAVTGLASGGATSGSEPEPSPSEASAADASSTDEPSPAASES